MTVQNQNKTFLNRMVKAACVMMAAVIMVLASGCDLSDIFGSSKEDEVTISQATAELKVGESVTLTATSSEGRAISWYSDNDNIAWVEAGEVTAVAEGTTKITATDGKKSATCEVTVKKADSQNPDPGPDNPDDPDKPTNPATITVTPSAVTLKKGGKTALTAKVSDNSSVTWASGDEKIATVSAQGTVTGVGFGSTTITATSQTAGTASCTVTVKPSIKIDFESKTIKEKESFTLTATTDDQSKITWSSSDANIASVTQNGVVKGINSGNAIITATSETAGSVTCSVTVNPDIETGDGYELVWSDEFNGTSLDMSKWGYQTGVQDNYYGNLGPEFWGNNEMQYYTDGANVRVSDGALQIIAKRENMDRGRTFSSARITTRDKYSVTFGRIEARMKTPAIEGMWPAFWMLPQPPDHSSTNNEYGGWPANGELDIMEAKGRLKNVIDTTLHFGGPDWNIHDMAGSGLNNKNSHNDEDIIAQYGTLPSTVTVSGTTEDWHTYGVEWTKDYIAWIIDGKVVCIVKSALWWTSAAANNGSTMSAPFDKPYYILLNLAVGGMYDGYKEPPASFQQAIMYVDYVRVFEKK